jgi:hypothetical protein
MALASATDGGDALRAAGAAVLADGDHRGFVEDDALAAHIDEGVGRAQVDRQVVGEQSH